MLKGQTFSAIGRHLLFLIVNPSEKFRLTIDFSKTVAPGGNNALPPVAAAIGSTREPFQLEGGGSGRAFSAPLQPQIIEGQAYVAIDLGVDGVRFPDTRTGLMNLYGKEVVFDVRKPVAFARDISAISEEDYARLGPPSSLRNFPNDLLNPELEYSGLFENGLTSSSVMLQLTQPPQARHFVIKGEVFTANTSFRLLIGKKTVGAQQLATGAFTLRLPVEAGQGKKLINMYFSNADKMDGQISGKHIAKLTYIGYE
ncbi:MAG: hypothetical protein HOP19_22775 [Acidobacteria bacterium]|nr:hypothetical protein [Acidobacteriota bacterium]